MKQLIIAVMLLVSLQAEARDRKVVYAFKEANACPSTGLMNGNAPCPGWRVDHGLPLCASGPDEQYNLFWQRDEPSYLKDKHERRICAEIARLRAENAILKARLAQ